MSDSPTGRCFPERQGREILAWWLPSAEAPRFGLVYAVLAAGQPETWGLCLFHDEGDVAQRVCPYARWTLTTDSLRAWLLAEGVDAESARQLVTDASEKRHLFADLRDSLEPT